MSAYEIDRILAEVEVAIELLNGQGFQSEVKRTLPPFGPQEAKAKLDSVWVNPEATDEQRAKTAKLRDQLWNKCGV
jgi:hypothetical protein